MSMGIKQTKILLLKYSNIWLKAQKIWYYLTCDIVHTEDENNHPRSIVLDDVSVLWQACSRDQCGPGLQQWDAASWWWLGWAGLNWAGLGWALFPGSLHHPRHSSWTHLMPHLLQFQADAATSLQWPPPAMAPLCHTSFQIPPSPQSSGFFKLHLSFRWKSCQLSWNIWH